MRVIVKGQLSFINFAAYLDPANEDWWDYKVKIIQKDYLRGDTCIVDVRMKWSKI